MYNFFKKHRHVIEIGWVVAGISGGMAEYNKQTNAAQVSMNRPHAVIAQAQPPTATGTTQPGPTPTTNVWVGPDFAYNAGFLAVGVSLVLAKVFDTIIAARLKWEQAYSSTAQGRLSSCEEQLANFVRNQQTKDEATNQTIKTISENLESIRKSNDALNAVVARQLETISHLTSKSVQVSIEGISTTNPPPTPQSDHH